MSKYLQNYNFCFLGIYCIKWKLFSAPTFFLNSDVPNISPGSLNTFDSFTPIIKPVPHVLKTELAVNHYELSTKTLIIRNWT